MKKDMNRRKPATRKRTGTEIKAWRFTLVIITCIVLSAVIGLYFKDTTRIQFDSRRVTMSFQLLTSWARLHTEKLHAKIVAVKQLAENNKQEPIHFEFHDR